MSQIATHYLSPKVLCFDLVMSSSKLSNIPAPIELTALFVAALVIVIII